MLPQLRAKPKATKHGRKTSQTGSIAINDWSCLKVKPRTLRRTRVRAGEIFASDSSSLRVKSVTRRWRKLRQKYAPKMEQLNERKRRAEQAVAREAEQAKGQKLQTAISFGATLLSSFMGRKTVSLSTLGRATTAVRGVGRSMKEAKDVDRAQDNVEAIAQKLADLDAEFKAETEKLERSFDPQTEELGKVSLKPTKTNISVKFLTLALGTVLARCARQRDASMGVEN